MNRDHTSQFGPERKIKGQQRRANLGSDAWLYGAAPDVQLLVPHFEAAGWKVVRRGGFCTQLSSTKTYVPNIAGLVRKHPEVAVFVRVYDEAHDRLKIIAGTKYVCAEAVEEMHVFNHADHYGVPQEANMFDY